MNRIQISISRRSYYSDLAALSDSYGIEVKKNGLVYCRAPIWFFIQDGFRTLDPFSKTSPVEDCFYPAIDQSFQISLVQDTPFPEEDGRQTFNTRWPFFVEAPLDLSVIYGRQFWTFIFTPGNEYRERRLPE